MQLDSIAKLINRFQKLPSVGYKTAQRYAYAVVDMNLTEAEAFINAINEVKKNVRYCSVCGNFSETQKCIICAKRASDTIVVVAYPKDVLAIEKAGIVKSVYHVLHGTLSPLEGRGV